MNSNLKSTVRGVVSMLTCGDYEALEQLTNKIRLTKKEMAEAIQAYGCKLIMPPDQAFDNLDVVEVECSRPRRWSVDVDLWTVEEGRSDLTLQLTLHERDQQLLDIEIDNIHVL